MPLSNGRYVKMLQVLTVWNKRLPKVYRGELTLDFIDKENNGYLILKLKGLLGSYLLITCLTEGINSFFKI